MESNEELINLPVNNKWDKFKTIKEKIIQRKEKIILAFLMFGIFGLIFKLLDLITIIYIILVLSSILSLVYFKIQELNKRGLISYMPPKIKNAILRRSIFDILMDIWYLPTITEYIKLLIKPVIYRMTPEEATKVLEDFDPSVRRFFLTKGIINLFPPKVKNALLPSIADDSIEQIANKSNSNNEENISASTMEDINHTISNKSVSIINTNANININERNNLINEHISNASVKEQGIVLYKKKEEVKENKNFELKTSENDNVSHIDDFIVDNILIEEKVMNHFCKFNTITHACDLYEKETPLMSEGSSIKGRKKESENSPINQVEVKYIKGEEYRFYEIEDEMGKVVFKTIVLESSEKMKKMTRNDSRASLKDIKNFCWDNYDAYYQKEAKKALKADNTPKTNFIQLFSKQILQRILSKIDYNKLSKGFVILLLTFVLQMIISKRARRWSVSLIHFAMYLAGSLGAGGTLYFLMKKKN